MSAPIEARITPRANVYFDGRCISHTLELADGTRKTVGVILPATLTFAVGEAERVEGVAGACEVRLPGSTDWQRFGAGDSFEVAANSSFDIRVSGEPYHYICHYG